MEPPIPISAIIPLWVVSSVLIGFCLLMGKMDPSDQWDRWCKWLAVSVFWPIVMTWAIVRGLYLWARDGW